MEIISYGSAAYGTKNSNNSKTSAFSFSKAQDIDFKGISNKLKGNFLYGLHCFRAGAKASVRFLWVIPAIVVVALVPSTVCRIMDAVEGHAKTVTFQDNSDLQVEYMAARMADFAMNGSVTFDAEGNIIDSESGIEELGVYPVMYKDPVVFQNYTVKSGDTISGISQKFGLKNISTLIAVNNIGNVRSLKAGEKLKIPSMDGMFHTVVSGESISSIAGKYNVSVADLLDVNDLTSDVVAVGVKLFIPGARMDSYSLKKAMGEVFTWPITATYKISSKFGYRKDPFTGVDSTHKGLDLACPTGTPIKAALSGTVTYAGWSNIYGYYVIINHFDGYQTLYGHMSKILVKKGQTVNQGSKIGLVGSTGYSTGPHLHFTVFKNGKLVDPLTVLK